MRMASRMALVLFLFVGLGSIAVLAGETTYLGPVTWSKETMIQVLSRDHQTIDEVNAPEGKVFLVCRFTELPSSTELAYDYREFKLEVEGESAALLSYGVSDLPPHLFTANVGYRSLSPREGLVFAVAFLVPASGNKGVLTVKDVKNPVSW